MFLIKEGIGSVSQLTHFLNLIQIIHLLEVKDVAVPSSHFSSLTQSFSEDFLIQYVFSELQRTFHQRSHK